MIVSRGPCKTPSHVLLDFLQVFCIDAVTHHLQLVPELVSLCSQRCDCREQLLHLLCRALNSGTLLLLSLHTLKLFSQLIQLERTKYTKIIRFMPSLH